MILTSKAYPGSVLQLIMTALMNYELPALAKICGWDIAPDSAQVITKIKKKK